MVPTDSGNLFLIHPHNRRGTYDTFIAYFNPTSLWSRLTSSKKGLRATPYQPNLMYKQFGLIEILHKCFIPKGESFFFFFNDNATETWLKSFHEFWKRKSFFLHDFYYTLFYHCTEEFKEWWALNYQNMPDHTLVAQRLVYAFSFLRDKGNYYRRDSK